MIVACSAKTRPLVFETFLEDGEREEKMSEPNLKHPKTAFWFTHMFVNVEFILVHQIFVYRGAVCFVVCFAWMSDSRNSCGGFPMLGSLHSHFNVTLAEKLPLPIRKGESDLVFQPSLINLGGGFKYFLFSLLLGEDSHFD